MLAALLPVGIQAATAITAVDVTGVTAPVAGAKPNRNFTVMTKGVKKALDGAWYNVTDSAWQNDLPFEAGKTYKFYAYVDVEDGYAWPEGYITELVTATLNGETAKIYGVGGESYKSVSDVRFVCTAPAVSTVDITAAWNEKHTQIASMSTSTPGCSVTNVQYAISGKAIDQVAPGDKVSIAFTVKLDSGYSFASSPKATWNGMNSVAYVAGSDSSTKRFVFELTVPSAATVITAVDVTGVTAPAAGAKPNGDFTVTTKGVKKARDGAWFNITDNKWQNDNPFKAGKTYKFCAYVDVEDGYAWPEGYITELVTATLNGETAKIYEVDSASYKSVSDVRFVCPGTAATEVTAVDITGVTAPVAGAKPNGDFTVMTKGVKKARDGAWFNITDNKPQYDNPFEAGKTYEFNAYVDVEDGYAWPEGYITELVTATLNGETAKIYGVGGESYKTVSVRFVCAEAATTITAVDITGVTEPVAGAKPSRDFTVATEGVKKAMDGAWYNDTDSAWQNDLPFEAGKTYKFYAYVDVEDGYAWADNIYDVTATMNGRDAAFAFLSGTSYRTVYRKNFFCTDGTGCEHKNTQRTGAAEATCTAPGYTGDVVCTDCGATLVKGTEIAVIAHTESDWITDQAADVGVEGARHTECTVCHTVMKTEAIPALTEACKHANTQTLGIAEATCTVPGYTGDTVCFDCGKVIKEGKETAVIAHTESDWITDKAAEVGADGAKHTECTVCRTVIRTEAIPALTEECKHSNTKRTGAVRATCTAFGYTGDTVCADCGKKLASGEEIVMTAHTESDWVIEKAAVVGAAGAKHTECTVCHAILKTETIPALTEECKHVSTQTLGVAEATCTAPGYTGRLFCADCGAELEKGTRIPALGHDFGQDGVCRRCGMKETAGSDVSGEAPTWWLWVLIAVVVIGGAVVIVIVSSRKNKAKK